MNRCLLVLNEVKVNIGDNVVLKDISIKINSSEIHVIMGPNGAGKSSLFKAICGHPNYIMEAKRCQICDEDILSLTPDLRAKKGLFMAFQHPCEIEGVTVSSFLRTIIKGFPENELSQLPAMKFYEHLYAFVEKVGLDKSFLTRSLNCGFSGGEKKRMEMLQLLLLQPKCILLDEIDSGLDIDALKIVVDTINTLKEAGSCLLIITHYSKLIDALQPNMIHLLQDGSIKKSGGIEMAKELEVSGYITDKQ